MSTHQPLRSLGAGDSVRGTYRLKQLVERQTPQGKKFVLGELQDASGVIGFVCWQAAQTELTTCSLVRVQGKVATHRDRLQVVATDLQAQQSSDLPHEVLYAADQVDVAACWQELLQLIDGLGDPGLKGLLHLILVDDPERSAAFQAAPAAVGMHHAYPHGLLAHTLSLCRLAERCCAQYPQLDRPLLLTGAILHDFGKIEELQWDGVPSYTSRGNLIGHLVGATLLIDRLAAQLPELPPRRVELLQHLVLSHHGELAYGAAREPVTREAIVLAAIDNLDSRLAGFDESLAASTSSDPEWTETSRMFGRRLYKG